HNAARTKIGLEAITWDRKLEASATEYSKTLQASGEFKHSNLPVGENLYKTSGVATCSDAAAAWIDERKIYNGEPIGQVPNTGHYTQIIYPRVTSFGC
ncbi:CAP domain-containing protein, partial [Globomyces pollinis-pini]